VLGLCLYGARWETRDTEGLQRANEAVNLGSSAISASFIVLAVAVGATLFMYAPRANLRMLGISMLSPGLGAPLLSGFGLALWVVFLGVWLSCDAHLQRRSVTSPARLRVAPDPAT